MLEPTKESEESIKVEQEICRLYNTSIQQVRKDVDILREWVRNQPHLPVMPNDTLLTSFLIACKNNMKLAKKTIDTYFTVRHEMPAFFQDRDPDGEKFKKIFEEIHMFTLPKLTPDNCRVTMGYLVTGDSGKYNLAALVSYAISFEDIKCSQESFVAGEYFLIDCAKISWGHMFKHPPLQCRDAMRVVQEAFPLNIQGIIVINAKKYVQVLLNIFRPFINAELFKKIYIHTEGPEIVEKYFPLGLMPKDYGGNEDTSKNLNDAWVQSLRNKRDWLITEGVATVDEKKRP